MSHDRPTPGSAVESASAGRHWLHRSATVARTHLRRVRRQQLESTWKVLLLAFVILFFGAIATGMSYLLYGLGASLASGDLAVGEYVGLLRGVVASLWVGLTVMVVARTAGSRGAKEATGGLLWVTETRTIVTGLIAAEAVGVALWVCLPAFVLSLGFAAGLGSPLPVLTVTLAALLLAITATAVGYPVGLAVRHVLTRFPFVKRYKTPLAVVGVLVYVGAISVGALSWLFAMLMEPLSRTPPGWLADLGLIQVPGVPTSPLLALLSVGLVAVVVPAVWAATRVADRHWFADPVLGEGGAESIDEGSTEQAAGSVVARRPRVEQILGRFLDRPTAALVLAAYRRAYRAPAKLLYAAMPFFFLLGYVPQVLSGGEVPPFTPVMLLLMITWAAGVAFVLNPLGDQGSVLPATVLSGVSGRQFVWAHLVASLAIVLPLGLVVPAGVALGSPLGTRSILLLLAVSPVVTVLGSLVGVGIGMLAPRFSSVRVSGSTQVVVPSKVAFAGYTVYLLAAAVAGLLVAREGARDLAAFVLDFLLPVSVSATAVLAVASVVMVACLLVPVACYRYAVGRFESVTLESAGA